MAALSAGGVALGLTEPRPVKLTVNDLVLLDRHWQEDDDHKSTELIDGRVYFTPARFIPRGRVALTLWERLREAAAIAAPHLYVGMRGSVEISPYDLPLPDIVLTSEAQGDGFIPAASVQLIVEVAETALDFFVGEKLRLYSRANIPEYWVVDIHACVIHRMWSPAGERYHERDEVAFGRPLTAVTISELTIGTERS